MGYPWIRHDLPPWEATKGCTATHGLYLGSNSWIVVQRVYDQAAKRETWAVLWFPVGKCGPRPSIAVVLFSARRIKGAKALAELWTKSSHVEVKTTDLAQLTWKRGVPHA